MTSLEPQTASLQLPPSATKALHIIVLLADTPHPHVQANYGTYHDIFTALFRQAILASEHDTTAAKDGTPPTAAHELSFESYEVVAGSYPSSDSIKHADGLLITGSAASAYAPLPWIETLTAFTASLPALNPKLKIFGICFGHQIIARAFGGEVVKNEKGWEVGVRRVELTELGKEVFGGEDGLLAIQQMHQDHVPSLPPGFSLLGSTPVSLVQGFLRLDPSAAPSSPISLPDVSIITLQGHPEFLPVIVERLIDAREANGVLTPDVAAASRGYAVEPDDGVKIGRIFLRILGV